MDMIDKTNIITTNSIQQRCKSRTNFCTLKVDQLFLVFIFKSGTRRILDNCIFCSRIIFLLLRRDKQNMKTDVLGNSCSSLISYIVKNGHWFFDHIIRLFSHFLPRTHILTYIERHWHSRNRHTHTHSIPQEFLRCLYYKELLDENA